MEISTTTAQSKTTGVLGRLVDETGAPKNPSHCIIQYGGRVRLPDKLVEILNNDFAPEVIWWQADGECFAFNADTVQEKVLDVWFRGTKLSSFIRSLNRWGFRRVFYHALPEAALAFHHASFSKKSTPDQLKSMKMSKSSKASSAIAAASATNAEVVHKADGIGNNHAPAVAQAPVMSTLPSFQQVASASALDQLLGSSGNLGSAAAGPTLPSSSQQMILKLLSEQRMTLSSKFQPLQQGSLHTALSRNANQQRELILLARAKQELKQQQDLKLAFFALQQQQQQQHQQQQGSNAL